MPGKFDFIETDRRILEQKIRRRQILPQEHQKWLKSLPDEREHLVEEPPPQETVGSKPSGGG